MMNRDEETTIKSVVHQLILKWDSDSILIGLKKNSAYVQKDIVGMVSNLLEAHDQAQRAVIEKLKGRLRVTAQLGIEAVGADGPEDAESVVGRMTAKIEQLTKAYRQELGRHKDTIHDLIVRQAADSAAYQQLMEKAVRFAQSVVDYDPYHDGKLKKEARALLKEREGT